MKFKIRSEVKQKRLSLTEDEIGHKSSRIIENLKSLLSLFPHANSFLFFYPLKGEPNLLPLAEELIKKGKQVSFPKVEGEELVPVRISSLKEFVPGAFGIPEPPFNPRNIVRKIHVAFIPGLAFDVFGHRIGYGKGFYDRFLKKSEIPVKVGICFEFQFFPEIPQHPFDIPVDYVVTEKRTVRRKEWRRF